MREKGKRQREQEEQSETQRPKATATETIIVINLLSVWGTRFRPCIRAHTPLVLFDFLFCVFFHFELNGVPCLKQSKYVVAMGATSFRHNKSIII